MKRRTLSGNEAKLILQLEWENVWLLDTTTIRRLLRCSGSYASYVAHSLVKKGWLEPAGKGHYLLIEAKRGYRKLAPRMTPYVILRTLNQPYYLAYLAAAYHHHLTTQLPRVLHVAVKRQRRSMLFKHVRVQFVTLKERKFFGHQKVKIDGESVAVSDLEKTLVDALDRPALVGGIEAVVRFIKTAAPRTDFNKLLQYTRLQGSRVLAVRLGYLIEELRIPRVPKYVLSELRRNVNHLLTPLGEVARWGKTGPVNPKWNILENVPVKNLFAEIEIA